MLEVKGKRNWVYRASGLPHHIVGTGSRLGNSRSLLSHRLVINSMDNLEEITSVQIILVCSKGSWKSLPLKSNTTLYRKLVRGSAINMWTSVFPAFTLSFLQGSASFLLHEDPRGCQSQLYLPCCSAAQESGRPLRVSLLPFLWTLLLFKGEQYHKIGPIRVTFGNSYQQGMKNWTNFREITSCKANILSLIMTIFTIR